MSWCVRAISATVFLAINVIAGCALPESPTAENKSEVSVWRGRLALRVEADHLQSESVSNTFSAGFELSGTSGVGELTLYTPMGGTVASLFWTADTACLRTNGEIRYFESLNALVRQMVGTDLPVAAFFAWLAGDNLTMSGWSADLSERAEGRITARRTVPLPIAELRLVLEK